MDNAATKSVTLTFPQNDYSTVERVIRGMGWQITPCQDDEEINNRPDLEEFARMVSLNEEHFEDMKAHDFYCNNPPCSEIPATIEELADELNEIESEGNVCDTDLERLRNERSRLSSLRLKA